MKRIIIMVVVLLAAGSLFAQIDADKEKAFREGASKAIGDTATVYGWKHGLGTGLTLTQVSFKDWASGGENALAYAVGLSGSSILNTRSVNWGTTYRFAYGQTRLGSVGVRKTTDDIYLESVLIYKVWNSVNPYAAATFRTQFAPGFRYDVDGKGTDVQVSKFFDPAYLTQSVGMAYRPLPEVTTRLGVGVREIFASVYTQYTDDPATAAVERSKVQGGIESVTEVSWGVAENMALTASLALFSPFTSPDRIVVRSDNTITAKVNSAINVSLNVQLINDPDISARTQIREALALGLSFTIF